jgi:SAM-dependent methyltransferase
MPPIALRRSVGGDDSGFDNPTGALVYDDIPPAAYERVFDFGCGCGRLARQMLQQRAARPKKYLGIDLHKAAVQWASANLSPLDPNFRFEHFNVHNRQFNPAATQAQLTFPTHDKFTLAIANSVFTHILEGDVAFYMRELARILAPGAYFVSTWFFFDKRSFPMMQEFQNSLYINLDDPTNAVIYDLEFAKALFRAAGLTIAKVVPPRLRGFQWRLTAVPRDGRPEAEFPQDMAPYGLARPPLSMGS